MSEPPYVLARPVRTSAGALRRELLALRSDARTTVEVTARETRGAVALSGLTEPTLKAISGVARVMSLRIVVGPSSDRALLLGPLLLLSEAVKDLPVEAAEPIGRALATLRGERPPARLEHRTGTLALDRPAVMGIVNATPDSFSDGGLRLEPAAAIEHGLRLADEGAAVVDVGGESTRPGAADVPADEELRRTLPVVEALAAREVLVSIDTRKPEVARRALEAGASIVNDVSGLREPAMRAAIAEAGAGAIVMHMRGEPGTMQEEPVYDDVVGEVARYLAGQVRQAMADGIRAEALAVDPGIGFGKTHAHNLQLLRDLEVLAALGRPVLIGASRKSFLGKLTGGRPPEGRVAASVAVALDAVGRGADLLRVHDVAETVDALRVREALVDSGSAPGY